MARTKSAYRPEWCEKLPKMFEGGKTVSDVCKKLGIVRAMFYHYMEKHPEFKEAYEIARTNGSKYRPEWCDDLPQMFAEGQDVIEVATALGISIKSFYLYLDKYPEFKEAYAIGKQLSESWWHARLRHGIVNGIQPGTAPVLIFALKNKCGMKDKLDLDHSNDDGSLSKPTVIELVAPSVIDVESEDAD